MLLNRRSLLAILHDWLAVLIAWVAAYWIRFNLEIPSDFVEEMKETLPWVVPMQGVVFWVFGLYRGIWRYASINDLRNIVMAVLFSAAVVPSLFWMLRLDVILPRSVIVLYPLLLLLMMGGDRLLFRLWKERKLYGGFRLQGEPVLILGAGDAAVALTRELERSPDWRPIGFLDDNAHKHGRMLNGLRVWGGLDSLAENARLHSIKHGIIAMPSATHQQRKRASELCEQAGVNVLTVPSFGDLLSGRVSVSQLRPIELDDLLGRDPVELDNAGLHALLEGQTVLVTGAGGSIGSELCRQIVRFIPKKLILFEANEFALYQIEQELHGKLSQGGLLPIVGDVRDAERIEEILAGHRPTVIFHAAAYKHVPLMEELNAWQAVRNNVLGTWTIARAAQRHGVEKFILISTDKAVNPTNVMGATKRLAETVCQGLQKQGSTRFVMVRFGNVLGSNGSVIPKFREQIAHGGPITVTHPEITRYFMSIPEAAQLVLQAGLMGQGGEIFVLDMGEPVKIVDLAKELIHLSGLSAEEIKIEFTGLRPGEKLYEELLADNEHTLPTPHAKLRIARAQAVAPEWLEAMLCWVRSKPSMADDEVRAGLKQWVPEYAPDSSKA